MDLVIAFLAFVFLSIGNACRMMWCSPRRSASVYRHSREIIEDIIGRYGGVSQRSGWKKLTYLSPDQKIQLEVNCNSRPRLILRNATAVTDPVSLYRMPRLLFAFFEAFIPPELRLDHLPYISFHSVRDSIAGLKAKSGFLALMEKLSRFGLSMRLNEGGITLWKQIRRADLNEFVFQEMIKLARDFGEVCTLEVVNIPVQPIPSEKRCAYCKELLEENSAIIYCSVWSTPHHRDCFQLNGRCSVFGCASTLTTETQSSQSSPIVYS